MSNPSEPVDPRYERERAHTDPGRRAMDQPDDERAASLPPGAGTKPSMGAPGSVEQSRPFDEMSGPEGMPGSAPPDRPGQGGSLDQGVGTGRTANQQEGSIMANERTRSRRGATAANQADIERRTTGDAGMADARREEGWGWARILTLVSALAFIAIGIWGFIETGLDQFAHHDTGITVLGFEVNPLHNIVHLAFGVIGLALATSRANAARFGVLLLVGYGAAVVYGLFALGETWDVLSLNAADNWLHLGFAALGLVILLVAAAEDPSRRNPTSTRSGMR